MLVRSHAPYLCALVDPTSSWPRVPLGYKVRIFGQDPEKSFSSQRRESHSTIGAISLGLELKFWSLTIGQRLALFGYVFFLDKVAGSLEEEEYIWFAFVRVASISRKHSVFLDEIPLFTLLRFYSRPKLPDYSSAISCNDLHLRIRKPSLISLIVWLAAFPIQPRARAEPWRRASQDNFIHPPTSRSTRLHLGSSISWSSEENLPTVTRRPSYGTRRLPIVARSGVEMLLICIDRGGTEEERACTFVRSLVNPAWTQRAWRCVPDHRSPMLNARMDAHQHAHTRDRDNRSIYVTGRVCRARTKETFPHYSIAGRVRIPDRRNVWVTRRRMLSAGNDHDWMRMRPREPIQLTSAACHC